MLNSKVVKYVLLVFFVSGEAYNFELPQIAILAA
jgi:hypothetical protein